MPLAKRKIIEGTFCWGQNSNFKYCGLHPLRSTDEIPIPVGDPSAAVWSLMRLSAAVLSHLSLGCTPHSTIHVDLLRLLLGTIFFLFSWVEGDDCYDLSGYVRKPYSNVSYFLHFNFQVIIYSFFLIFIYLFFCKCALQGFLRVQVPWESR